VTSTTRTIGAACITVTLTACSPAIDHRASQSNLPPAAPAECYAKPPLEAGVQEPVRENRVQPALKRPSSGDRYAFVCLDAIVGEDGVLRDIRVTMSSNPVHNVPSIQAVKQWRYRPATKDGKAVPVPTRIVVTAEWH
jgi:hypothetical protein